MSKYKAEYEIGRPGMRADATDACRMTGYTALATLSFGQAVSLDANNLLIKATDATTVVGITMRDALHESHYVAGDVVTYFTKGHIYVKPSVAVVANTLAYVTADGNITNVALDNNLLGMFLTSADANAITVLDFDYEALNIKE